MEMRSTATTAARHALKAGGRAWDLLRPAPAGVTILIFHRVGAGAGGQMDLSPAVFDDQLRWLRATQRVVSLDDAATELSRGGPVTSGVVITFDDGTTDWVDHVLPALDRHEVPATFYVATDFVDRQMPFPGDGTPISWSGLRELASSPLVTIGSHTHRHLLLDRLPPGEIDEELDRSVELLRDRLEIDPVHFAYPKAVAGSAEADAAVRARFRTAVLAGTRPNPAQSDLHRLARSPVQASDTPRWFQAKATGGLRLEDDLRRAANRLRYRHATR